MAEALDQALKDQVFDYIKQAIDKTMPEYISGGKNLIKAELKREVENWRTMFKDDANSASKTLDKRIAEAVKALNDQKAAILTTIVQQADEWAEAFGADEKVVDLLSNLEDLLDPAKTIAITIDKIMKGKLTKKDVIVLAWNILLVVYVIWDMWTKFMG